MSIAFLFIYILFCHVTYFQEESDNTRFPAEHFPHKILNIFIYIFFISHISPWAFNRTIDKQVNLHVNNTEQFVEFCLQYTIWIIS